VSQSRLGRLVVQSVVVPELKLTVPVASPGRPEADSDTALPYAVTPGAAEADIEYSDDLVIVKLVEAEEPS
jgi:hypothetical protein